MILFRDLHYLWLEVPADLLQVALVAAGVFAGVLFVVMALKELLVINVVMTLRLPKTANPILVHAHQCLVQHRV